jgi:hypothetical protein
LENLVAKFAKLAITTLGLNLRCSRNGFICRENGVSKEDMLNIINHACGNGITNI